jgi:hypothetical protein
MTKALEEPPRRADTGSRTDNPTRVERLQQDMLACLRKPGHDPISYAGLAYCGPQGAEGSAAPRRAGTEIAVASGLNSSHP